MRFGRTLASTMVAASLVSAPVVAQAAAPQRLDSDVQGENLRGGFIVPLIAIIAVILGILVLVDDEDEATSP